MNDSLIFVNKRLEKAELECHAAAMEFIDIISDSGIQQMKEEGVSFDTKDFNPSEIARYAAKKLGLDEEGTISKYIDLMILEKMVEMVPAI